MRRKIRLFAGLAVALALLGGLMTLESRSLPGDILYVLKTSIDEPLTALESSFSAESRTQVAASQAEARLVEAEHLAAQQRLDPATAKMLTVSFNARSGDAIRGIDELALGNAEAGASIASLFTAALSAHAGVLQGLPGNEAAMMLSEVAKARATLEVTGNRTTRALLSGRAGADMESAAWHAIEQAGSEIVAARYAAASPAGMHAAAGQELQLSAAEDALAAAKDKQDAKVYIDAFNLALRARGQAHAVRIVSDAAGY
ncbi:MAG TPA: DUF5667 domain-containing protein [Candidatus Peribacteria bacterium]|nr:DUF5667 domain-containing protein [Candidatus Peribacteria bacterium]